VNEEPPQFELKAISKGGVDAALRKAERYRLLNERQEAVSIGRDVLEVDPDNQKAVVIMILALSDLFSDGVAKIVKEARELVSRLDGEYMRAYYSGVVCERSAKAIFQTSGIGTGPVVYESLLEAMDWYEKAESMRPPGNDDALLRWNTCARLIMNHHELHPAPKDEIEPFLE
jgi:tetratricopeptide (TPR) repeat protein